MDDLQMLKEQSSWDEFPALPEPSAWDAPPADVDPGSRIDSQFARAEFAGREIARATARQLAAIHDAIREARDFPEIFVGPGNAPSRGRDGQNREAEDRKRLEFAERAAITELALNLGLSQNTVRNRLVEATLLITRLPIVWAQFAEGELSYQNVRAILEAAAALPTGDLPDDDTVWAEYDSTLAGPAGTVNPARMRILARSLAEKLAAEPLSARHTRAAADRRVWVEPAADGMAWLGSLQPAEAAYRAYARVNANAKHLASLPDEARSINQIRADVMADILTGDGTPHEVKATVTVTVPVLSLLNHDVAAPEQPPQLRHMDMADDADNTDRPRHHDKSGRLGQADLTSRLGQANQPGRFPQPDLTSRLGQANQPGRLNGYGPIDPETARRLAAKAPSFFRILTHPVTSAILDVDRTSYTVPADLKRWILAAHTYCVFPGCNRLASECDIDHSLDWAFSGTTSAHNLAPLCRGDHRLKHRTRWKIIRHRDGRIQWKSPRGRIHDTDPPPF